jgi:hypothetical protein
MVRERVWLPAPHVALHALQEENDVTVQLMIGVHGSPKHENCMRLKPEGHEAHVPALLFEYPRPT